MSDQIENKIVTKIEERAAVEIDRPLPSQAVSSTTTDDSGQSVDTDKQQ